MTSVTGDQKCFSYVVKCVILCNAKDVCHICSVSSVFAVVCLSKGAIVRVEQGIKGQERNLSVEGTL